MPKGAAWIKDRVVDIDPEQQQVTTQSGARVGYDFLVCPGIQLDWDKIPGMAEAMKAPHSSSNYTYDLAPKTWDLIRGMKSGRALFTMPAGPIKCAGAPQKIAYLAADYWRQQGVLKDIEVTLVLPTPGMFGVKVFADELERVVARYGIQVRKSSEMVEVDPDNPAGYVQVDKNTMQHTRYPNVFALGVAGSTPNSKTGRRSGLRSS